MSCFFGDEYILYATKWLSDLPVRSLAENPRQPSWIGFAQPIQLQKMIVVHKIVQMVSEDVWRDHAYYIYILLYILLYIECMNHIYMM